mmetsp:Transcript_112867/g.324365  ORF Transcript_112867/g.324365 Transcript_112867/m.324365 type:complete len:296 (+) Transcript_112867:76-963(+)
MTPASACAEEFGESSPVPAADAVGAGIVRWRFGPSASASEHDHMGDGDQPSDAAGAALPELQAHIPPAVPDGPCGPRSSATRRHRAAPTAAPTSSVVAATFGPAPPALESDTCKPRPGASQPPPPVEAIGANAATLAPGDTLCHMAAGTGVDMLPGGRRLLRWAVMSRVLSTTNKSAVSPEFQVDIGQLGPQPFRLVLYPVKKGDGKGCGSFRRARGQGRIELKCEAQLPESAPAMSVSFGVGPTEDLSRGAVYHWFARQNICGLPPDHDQWDFNAAATDSMTFSVFAIVGPVES